MSFMEPNRWRIGQLRQRMGAGAEKTILFGSFSHHRRKEPSTRLRPIDGCKPNRLTSASTVPFRFFFLSLSGRRGKAKHRYISVHINNIYIHIHTYVFFPFL
jgi:hypothetical protein